MMNIKIWTNLTLCYFLLYVCLALAIPIESFADWQLSDLMQLLAQKKSGKAFFTEKKYIGMLDRPLESSGELSFTAPNRFEKRTLKPTSEYLKLDGDQCIMERFVISDFFEIESLNTRRFAFNLREHPEVLAFIESIRATLAGDLKALEKYYELELSGSEQQWQLVLTPKQAKMLDIIKHIRVNGSSAAVNKIDLEQADGDRNEMIINNIFSE